MENLDKAKDAFKQMKNGTIVLEKEEQDTVYFFILTLDGDAFKTSIECKVLENLRGDEAEFISSLEYSPVDKDDIEFFNLKKRAYTLDQSTVIVLKKFINRIEQ